MKIFVIEIEVTCIKQSSVPYVKLSSKDLPHTFCEAVSPALTEGAPSSGLRPCIRSHPRERVLGGPRCHREEVTSNPLHRDTLLRRIQCASSKFAIAALYSFHSLLSDATRPWTQAASAKRRPTRHLRSPTAARPRRSSSWYVSLSSYTLLQGMHRSLGARAGG